jgi:hypothetical protein
MNEQVFDGYCVGGPYDRQRLRCGSEFMRVAIREPTDPVWRENPEPLTGKVRTGEYRWHWHWQAWVYLGES